MVIDALSSREGADIIPYLCNDFVLYYCPHYSNLPLMPPSSDDLISQTAYMCDWLNKQGHIQVRLLRNDD